MPAASERAISGPDSRVSMPRRMRGLPPFFSAMRERFAERVHRRRIERILVRLRRGCRRFRRVVSWVSGSPCWCCRRRVAVVSVVRSACRRADLGEHRNRDLRRERRDDPHQRRVGDDGTFCTNVAVRPVMIMRSVATSLSFMICDVGPDDQRAAPGSARPGRRDSRPAARRRGTAGSAPRAGRASRREKRTLFGTM